MERHLTDRRRAWMVFRSGAVVVEGVPGPRSWRRGLGAGRVRQVWVLKDGVAQAVNVQVGISDGRKTEVSGEGLAEGMAVITDQRSAGAAP